MSGEERRGRRASNIRGAGKKLEFSRVEGEQERERAQRPAIVSLRLLLVNGGGQSPVVGNNGVTH